MNSSPGKVLPVGIGIALAVTLTPGLAAASPRVVSLDQCADQYVLALATRTSIAGLSRRADDPDSRLRDLARGLPTLRVTSESLLSLQPQIAVRYWGGDSRLERGLRSRGVQVVQISEVNDFNGIRSNIRYVAEALNANPRGEALIREMDRQLAHSAGAWRGQSALYLTPSGFTAGDGTLVGAILRAAGLTNAAPRPGFAAAPLEAMVLKPPRGFVLGFFDQLSAAFERWGIGRHLSLQRQVTGRTLASVPGSILSCPAWFAADGVALIARGAGD